MARFYGTIQGQRGEATRLGHKSLRVTAQSYDGDVTVVLSREPEGDTVCIYASPHSNGYRATTIFAGKIADLINFDGQGLVLHHAHKMLTEQRATDDN